MLYDKKWDQEVKVVDEVGQVMLKAADYLEEHGHCKHVLFNDKGAVCIRGAFMKVGSFAQLNEAELRLKEFGIPWNELIGVVDWNNAPERTGEEVIAVLRAAACP